jgi:CheY-like chemotaxis protein
MKDGSPADAHEVLVTAAVRVAGAHAGARASSARESDGASVLVVEPDPDLQWRLARMLTVHGHRVVGASSGDGALALAREWPVDLVLVDETLPARGGLSALALTRALRAAHPEVRVVLLTAAGAPPEPHLAARVAGVVACLARPFRPEAIAEALRVLTPRFPLAASLHATRWSSTAQP